MMEDHVTDDFILWNEFCDQKRGVMRSLYEEALKGDKEALFELMSEVCSYGYWTNHG